MTYQYHITIFGGTGDLTFRKLLPALYNMSASGKLPDDSRILVIGRRDYDSQAYRSMAKGWVENKTRVPYKEEVFHKLAERIHYYQMDFTDLSAYQALNDFYAQDQIQTHVFYFAVAPRFFSVITDGLSQVDGAKNGRVIIEKPFGKSLEDAAALNQKLEALFTKNRIYRIDHYLGKEMVRNIQAIRFMNPIFTDVWNSKYIESVQISAMEDLGVEKRGGYYDASGALKDMVQNHLFQIMSIVAMEKPEKFFGSEMHEKQVEVLKALRPVDQDTIEDALVMGQYEGYRQEPLVAPDSVTETYGALRLFVDNGRWKGTPFYIRTGKKLGTKEMRVSIVFRRATPEVEPNILTIRIQPEEGVHFQFNIKRPGDTDEILAAEMDFCQNCSVVHRLNTPEAYERLLTACLREERSWFSQWDQIETSWRYVEDLTRCYRQKGLPLYPYQPGSLGPSQADEFLSKFGHRWEESGEILFRVD